MLFLTPNRVKALKTINKLEGKYALESTDPRESEFVPTCVRNSLLSELS